MKASDYMLIWFPWTAFLGIDPRKSRKLLLDAGRLVPNPG